MQEKHVKLTLDFTISIEDSIPDPLPNHTPIEWGHEKSQMFKHLFRILLAEKEVLKKILAVQVSDELANIADHELLPDWIYGSEEPFSMLAPAIAQLPTKEQEEFRAGKDNGVEYEFASYCFSTGLVRTEIAICDCEVQG